MNKSRFFILVLLFAFSAATYAESKQIQLANRVIQSVSRKYAPDKRTAIFSVQISESAGKIVLKGKTDHPEAQKLLLDSLAILQINVQDSVLILPDKLLGDKTWGLVKLSVANLRIKPAHAEEMATQALMGTPVKILEEKDEWWLVQTPDLYIAWANHGAIIPKTAEEMTNWKKSNRYIYNQLNGFAYSEPDKKAMPVTDLVICDLFEVTGETKGYLQALLPDGRAAYVKKNECLSFEDWTMRPLQISSVMQVARQMMGVPYFWGGTSSKAVDCSGLTKTSYYSQGVVLARDASQQVRYGMHPDFSDYRNLQPGDLIFFGSSAQRVTHVGLCLGDGLFIHASGSSAMVRLNSLNPNDTLFDANLLKIVVGSSRIANSLNTEGITLVKDHPWYSLP